LGECAKNAPSTVGAGFAGLLDQATAVFRLIEHVYAFAAQEKAAKVWWLTHETNQHAMLLYDTIAEKSGFVQYRKFLPL
jgi:hypothetical protein